MLVILIHMCGKSYSVHVALDESVLVAGYRARF